MNEEIETTELEQPAAESEAPTPEPELSLSEHEAQYPGGQKPPVVETAAPEETPEQQTARETQQARDKDTGQFKEGRRRAKSQRASAEDVPRIKELTRQLRERDEELARLRTPPAPVVPGSTNGNGHAPAAAQVVPSQSTTAKPGERYILPAPPFDPEPQENDAKYNGDFTRYLREVSAWEGRQAVRQAQFDQQVETFHREQQQTQERELSEFAQRVDAARSEYEDFD